MKNWTSQINSLRFLAILEVALVICGIAMPLWNHYLLPASVTIGLTLVGQLLFHSRSIEAAERPLDAEQTRLNLSH